MRLQRAAPLHTSVSICKNNSRWLSGATMFRRSPSWCDRLSYKGMGEPLCFLAFGPLATCAFFLAQVGVSIPTPSLLPYSRDS